MLMDHETTGWRAASAIPLSEINATRDNMIVILCVMAVFILVILCTVIVLIIRKLLRPLAGISRSMEEFAQGNMAIDIQAGDSDEVGRLAQSVCSSTRSLKKVIDSTAHILSEMSKGNLNLSVNGSYIGDFRFISEALEQIIESLSATLGQIRAATQQVSCGSEQVAEGAQSLAERFFCAVLR